MIAIIPGCPCASCNHGFVDCPQCHDAHCAHAQYHKYLCNQESRKAASNQTKENKMKKTITITDPMQVRIGDKAYFKDCDFGFPVHAIDRSNKYQPLMVNNPLDGDKFWARSRQFDHAIREVEEPEWPDPHDAKLHVYLGSDGKRYIYNPYSKQDPQPWDAENAIGFADRQQMARVFPEALPLTELRLVPMEAE